jgi:hypothetical protein
LRGCAFSLDGCIKRAPPCPDSRSVLQAHPRLSEQWVKEEELEGLSEEKLVYIRRIAGL